MWLAQTGVYELAPLAIFSVAYVMAQAVLVVGAWHLYQEKFKPGGNAQGININFFRSLDPWFPVTKFQDRYVHGGVFAILAACVAGWMWTDDPRWLDAAAGIFADDAVQHLGIFKRRVAGWGSAWGYAVVGFGWLAYRSTIDLAAAGLGFAFGLVLIFGNLGYLATRHWLRKRGRA